MVLRNIMNHFEFEKEESNYYAALRVDNFWKNYYIEKESKKEEYVNKTIPYLKGLINNTELTITINFW